MKREDLQHIRSYKIRGAFNFIHSLTEEEKKNGVVAASAGNHAQGVAISCQTLQVKGTIFMPQTTPSQKVRKTKKFGGEWVEVQLIGDSFDDAYQASVEFCEQQQAKFIHPFDDIKTITGQGTVAFEVIEDTPNGDVVDYVLAPIGGGGLISGVGSVFKEVMPTTKVIGVESEGSASMYKSIQEGAICTLDKVSTFADGVAVKTPGKLTFEIVKEVVDGFQIVPDGLTATTLLNLLDDQGIIVEPAGALSIAALDQMKEEIKGKKVVCIVSGGNFDFSRLPNVQEISLKYLELKKYFIISFPQRPGALREFLDILGPNDDIAYFEYIKKNSKERGPALVGIETNDPKNLAELKKRMKKNDIQFEDITKKELYFDLLI